MDILELNDKVGDLKTSIYSLCAIAGSFSSRYMESKDIFTAIKANPDDFAYLFYTILGFASDAKDKINDLMDFADRTLEEAQKNDSKGAN
jgi:hypothetical protein